jgi:hypothetical protein
MVDESAPFGFTVGVRETGDGGKRKERNEREE